MKINIHESKDRGHADHGWLKTWHSYNFANYFNPLRERFGVIRVFNDDIVDGGEGFGMHPHNNMEIVTIPLSGTLEHKDSIGNHGQIHDDEVQIMSAGTGLQHSEYNHSKIDPVNILQIWLFPKVKNIQPRYQQLSFNKKERDGKFQPLVSPELISDILWINQDAWFSRIDLQPFDKREYKLHKQNHVVLVFIIEGGVEIDGSKASRRDTVEISEITDSFEFTAESYSQLLFIEAPRD